MKIFSKIKLVFQSLFSYRPTAPAKPVVEPVALLEVPYYPPVAPVVEPVAPTPAPVIIKPDVPEVQAPWMEYAASYVGLKEIVGAKHNQTILGWAKNLGKKVGIVFDADEIAWCGLFTGEIMNHSGFTPPNICVRASEWTKFGVGINEGAYGAIMVFTRSGGGHVGFYVSEDETTYHILGGNQSNSVSITRIAKSRMTTIRWPAGIDLPKKGPVHRKFNGAISKNEA